MTSTILTLLLILQLVPLLPLVWWLVLAYVNPNAGAARLAQEESVWLS